MIVALQRSHDLTADLHPHGSFWWLLPDSNWGHKALQASALPTELKSRAVDLCILLEVDGSGKPLLVLQAGTDIAHGVH